MRTSNLVATESGEGDREDHDDGDAGEAIDGREDTAWTGAAGKTAWRLVGALRAPGPTWGSCARGSATLPPPRHPAPEMRWETLAAGSDPALRAPSPPTSTRSRSPSRARARPRGRPGSGSPARRDARGSSTSTRAGCVSSSAARTRARRSCARCGAIETAFSRRPSATARRATRAPGQASLQIPRSTAATRRAGREDPGAARWALQVDLPSPQTVDRIRLVLGYDATGVPRAHAGRTYAMAWGPEHYRLEVSEDGEAFVPVATEPLRADGSVLPLRRRLVTLAHPRPVRALRLVMTGATGAVGVADARGVPVVREIAAYRADDRKPILAAPWILSVNANPSAQTHAIPGGEQASDVLHAKFLQGRFARLLPSLRTDDRFARMLGPRGEVLDVPAKATTPGEALSRVDRGRRSGPRAGGLLSQSSPPPITVLGGSNDWDYAAETGPDSVASRRWHWDPLPDAGGGGMGRLASAVRGRVAPFVGFCGGAQILALLEASGSEPPSQDRDRKLIDRVLSRTSGMPIRGFAQPMDIERAWPGDPHPFRAKIRFAPIGPPVRGHLAGTRRSRDPPRTSLPGVARRRDPARRLRPRRAAPALRARRDEHLLRAGRRGIGPARGPLSQPVRIGLVRHGTRGVPLEGPVVAGHRRAVPRRAARLPDGRAGRPARGDGRPQAVHGRRLRGHRGRLRERYAP